MAQEYDLPNNAGVSGAGLDWSAIGGVDDKWLLMLRESVQNSLDAVDDTDTPVHLQYKYRKLSNTQLESLRNYLLGENENQQGLEADET